MSPDPVPDPGSEPSLLDRPLQSGPLRISGAVLEGDAAWHVFEDSLGWTNVVLMGRDPATRDEPLVPLEPILREASDASADPMTTAELIAHRLGAQSFRTELGIVRVGPYQRLVEVLNVSLPALVHWDPTEGMSPYEPVAASLGELPPGAMTEIVRLRPGAILTGATRGLISANADWGELRRFLRATAVDPVGGDVAEAAPSELARVVRHGWEPGGGPSGLVMVGIPRVHRQVA